MESPLSKCCLTMDLGFVSSEASGQPGHSPSVIRILSVLIKQAKALSFPFSSYSEDSDQTWQMRSLI